MSRVPANPSRRIHDDEELLFRSEAVIVTSRRILFKTRSYVASAVTTVKVQEQKDQPHQKGISGAAVGMLFLLGGSGLAFAGVYWGGDRAPAVLPIFLALGLLIAIMGLLMFRFGRAATQTDGGDRFAVMFTTVDGQRERITGLTRPVAEQIAAAVSDASIGIQVPPAHQSEAG